MKISIDQKVEQNFGNIICKFPILHHEWELDGYGYIVEKDGKRSVILSDHNKCYTASIEDLNIKISDYRSAIQETERAIFLLK
jgi:hypothetical protein